MKKLLLLLVTLVAGTAVWAENYITDVMVIGGTKTVVNNLKDSLTTKGWTFINKDLNAGCGSSSDYIYLLYKSASETTVGTTFITNFLVSTATGTIPDSFTDNYRTYHLVPFAGSTYFVNNKGDLNSHCGSGSATIHLYYTKDYDRDGKDYATVKSITFNDTQDGGVIAVGDSTGYDLNTGCGSSSDYIYMHAGKAPGWILSVNTAGTQCHITGFEGPKPLFTSIMIPVSIDKATVLGISNTTFSGFSNLESMTFGGNTSIDRMPSVQGCSKFEHVNTSGVVEVFTDRTPPSMTRIPSSAFVGTAIKKLTLDSVTYVGSNAFKGCDSLTSVTFKKSPVLIENGAFSDIFNIDYLGQVSYPGSMEDWNPMMYMYSPRLVIHNKKSWYCGWCGGKSTPNDTISIYTANNHLYWTLQNDHLKINCATDNWAYYPDKQVISFYNWLNYIQVSQVKYLTLEHVASIEGYGFENYDKLISVDVKSGLKMIGNSAFYECDSLQRVYLPSCLDTIGQRAFHDCHKLSDLYFDGSLTQWNAVGKGPEWNAFVAENYKEHWHCLVTFNANGHGIAPNPVAVQWSNEDKLDEPTAPTAAGYNFCGWYKEPECFNPWDFANDIVPGDMTLYAEWEPEPLLGDVNGDGDVNVIDITALIDEIMNDGTNPRADVNEDGEINVIDITALIDIIMNS